MTLYEKILMNLFTFAANVYNCYFNMLYGGRGLLSYSNPSCTFWYRFVEDNEPGSYSCRLTLKFPFLELCKQNYTLTTQQPSVKPHYCVQVNENGRVKFNCSKPRKKWLVGDSDHSKVFYCSLNEVSTNITYDVTKIIQCIQSELMGYDLYVFEIYPMLMEIYNIRYTPPEDLELEIVLDDTFDTLTFHSFELFKV